MFAPRAVFHSVMAQGPAQHNKAHLAPQLSGIVTSVTSSAGQDIGDTLRKNSYEVLAFSMGWRRRASSDARSGGRCQGSERWLPQLCIACYLLCTHKLLGISRSRLKQERQVHRKPNRRRIRACARVFSTLFVCVTPRSVASPVE